MGHHHHHHHHHTGNAIAVAFFLNFGFTIVEFVGGWYTNSMAIMADAIHDLGDTLAIGLAWWLSWLSTQQANEDYTYGYSRLSLLGALVNATILVAGSIWVLYEAIPRLSAPVMPHATGMIALAVLGVVVNGYAAWRLSHGKTLNERVLNWHLIEDVLGWAAVLIVAITLMFVQWPILDPILSIGFTLFILLNVFRNLRQTVRLFLQAAPDEELVSQVRMELSAIEHVAAIHHLHIWSLDGERHVMTAHLELDMLSNLSQQGSIKQAISTRLEKFQFSHTTIELELSEEACRDSQS